MRALRTTRNRFAIFASILLLAGATPAQAALDLGLDFTWEGSRAQEVTSTALDLLFVRPLATGRVIVGGLFFLPAALISLPMGQEGFDGALDTFVTEPSEYAFQRKIGEL